MLIAPLIPVSAEEPRKIVLVGSLDVKENFEGRWLTLIYTELFRRLGYSLQYDAYPLARASRMSDAGEVDGEINRVYLHGDSHPA